jgi:hypothetical protein
MMKTRTSVSTLFLTPWLLSAPAAQAMVVYDNDFQTAAGVEWSQTTLQDTPTPYPSGPRSFLGEFGNETVSLNLSGLGAHSSVRVQFDLYLIRSWDGSSGGTTFDYGNDSFRLAVDNGPVLLDETFGNGNPAGQTFGAPSGTLVPYHTGALETYSLGYEYYDAIQNSSQVMDSVYRFSFEFAHSSSLLAFDFGAYGLQSLDDESWGLDNVRVSLVPEPATAWMFALGALAVGWRLRRSQAS